MIRSRGLAMPQRARHVVPLAVLLCAVVAVLPTWELNHDLGADALHVAAALARPFAALTWPMLAWLVVLAGLHYVAAATAARAAIGVPLPFAELLAAQFASSTANRLTPAGLGGAAVNGRYFVRRGQVSTGAAAAAVSAMTVLGGLADVLGFAAVMGLGAAAGLPGVRGEVPLLLRQLTSLLPGSSRFFWIAGAGLCALAAAGCCLPRVRSALARRARGLLRGYGAGVRALTRRPGRVSVLVAASASTTVCLAAGFAAAATVGPSAVPLGEFCALMIGYMVAAAAANALPTPGGIGAADAALVGVLTASGTSVGTAVPTVLAFRAITFWAPACAGIGCARMLRRRGAI